MTTQDPAPGTPGATATPPTTTITPPTQAPAGAGVQSLDDDPEADGAPRRRFEISEVGLKARLDRAKRQAAEEARAAVLAELGITDKAQLTKEREEAKALREAQEKAERERMTREEQLSKDLEAERAKREKAEATSQQATRTATYAQEDARITQIAIRHVDASSSVKVKAAKIEFSDYVERLTEAQRARLSEASIDRWFRRFIKDNPDFAPRAAEPPAGAPAPKPPVTRPIHAPAPKAPRAATPQSQDPTMGANGKTTLPGKPNSMNKQELRDHLKKRGQRGW